MTDDRRRIIEAKYGDYCDRIVRLVQDLPDDCRQSGDDSVLTDVWEEYLDVVTSLIHSEVKGLDTATKRAIWLQTEEGMDWTFDNDEREVQAYSAI